MTAKELKIREVYGDKYDQCQPNENGWTDMYEHHPFEVDFDDYDMQEGNVFNTFWRPKSLAGIEDNNGWNRIDEVGLPKEQGVYCVKSILTGRFIPNVRFIKEKEFEDFWKERYSHWSIPFKFFQPKY